MPLKKNENKWWMGMILGGLVAVVGLIGVITLFGENRNKI
jgi:hypothetical protein